MAMAVSQSKRTLKHRLAIRKSRSSYNLEMEMLQNNRWLTLQRHHAFAQVVQPYFRMQICGKIGASELTFSGSLSVRYFNFWSYEAAFLLVLFVSVFVVIALGVVGNAIILTPHRGVFNSCLETRLRYQCRYAHVSHWRHISKRESQSPDPKN